MGQGLRPGRAARREDPEEEAAERSRRPRRGRRPGVRRRLRVDHRSRGVRRPRAPRGVRPGVPRGRGRATRSPSQTIFGIGLGMVAPTILAHAIPEVSERYLRPLYRGDLVGCQLFSEPVAGSDLAGIQTRAVRDGDEWIVTGQKVWTSGAQYSDIGEIITRTSTRQAEAQGPDDVRRRHEGAGRRGAPAPADDGWCFVQRGVLRRGARPRLAPPR